MSTEAPLLNTVLFKTEMKSCMLRGVSCKTLVLQVSACASAFLIMVAFLKEIGQRARFFHETKYVAGKTYQIKCAAGQIFLTES